MWEIFKVTDQCLENLNSEGVPVEIREKVRIIKNQEIIGRRQFEDTLTKHRVSETDQYKSLILKHAKLHRGEFTQGRRDNTPIRQTESGLSPNAEWVDDWHGNWQVFAIRNADPLLPEVDSKYEAERSGEVMFEKIAGIGCSDVIIESPGIDQLPQKFHQSYNTLTDEQLHQIRDEPLPWDAHRPLGVLEEVSCQLILDMLLTRFKQLQEDPRIRYVSIFRNHRPESGATLEHPHSQIVASPIIPAQVADELENAQKHFSGLYGRCVLCGLRRAELASDHRLGMLGNSRHPKSRVLYSTRDFVVIHPYASTSPFETWIVPTAHQPSFGDIKPVALQNLAHVLAWALGRLYICLDDPAYNMVFKTAPFPPPERREKEKELFGFYHWYIVIQPQRLVTPGGYELSTGIPVNVAPPESEVDDNGQVTWIGSAEFFRTRGVLFEDNENKIGTLKWYLKEPTETDTSINITWESKQKTLRNIIAVLRREDTSGVEEHKLTEEQRKMLKEIEIELEIRHFKTSGG